MKKDYRTSVRRAAKKLAGLAASHEYTSTFEEDDQLLEDIQEVSDWLVARDKQHRERIANFVKERIRNATV